MLIDHPFIAKSFVSFKKKGRTEVGGDIISLENLIRFQGQDPTPEGRFYPKTVLPVQMGRRSNRVVCEAHYIYRNTHIYIYIYEHTGARLVSEDVIYLGRAGNVTLFFPGDLLPRIYHR